VLRLKSLAPSRASSRAIARLTPGGDMPIASAAATKDPASTTAANTPIPLERFSILDFMAHLLAMFCRSCTIREFMSFI
jgi:hypothetical protein